MHHVLAILLTAVASAIAAWWGGKLGVQREAEKITIQRAIDRRLDWYERAVKTLTEYKKATLKAAQIVWSGGPEAAQAQQEYRELVSRANDVLNEGGLYARPTTITAFRTMNAELQRIMREARVHGPSASEPLQPDLKAVERAMNSAWAQLVKEGREHLGLEPLPDDQFAPGPSI
jgi:hypothetical protein